MFTGVLATEKCGQIFTWELELRNENIMIIGGELFLRGNDFSNFSSGIRLFAAEVSLVRLLLPRRFTAWLGTDFAQSFSPGKSRG